MLPGTPVHMPAHKHKAPKHKKAKQPVKRKLAPGEGVACCAAEALAASLRLAGQRVTDDDVLALYWRTAGDPDEGATIEATLEAAQRFGLAGYRPEDARPVSTHSSWCEGAARARLTFAGVPSLLLGVASGARDFPAGLALALGHANGGQCDATPLILGVTLPGGPHALALDPSGAVWSWGELYDPGDLSLGSAEEAWLVSWA